VSTYAKLVAGDVETLQALANGAGLPAVPTWLVAEQLGVHKRTAKRRLTDLANKGLVRRSGGRWHELWKLSVRGEEVLEVARAQAQLSVAR
jgi:DNA-binding IclR family transcriptional regulator